MSGDERTVLEDADLVRQRVHLDQPLPGGVGDAVEIAAETVPSCETRPLQFEHQPNGNDGNSCSFGCSSVKASATTRRVVA